MNHADILIWYARKMYTCISKESVGTKVNINVMSLSFQLRFLFRHLGSLMVIICNDHDGAWMTRFGEGERLTQLGRIGERAGRRS